MQSLGSKSFTEEISNGGAKGQTWRGREAWFAEEDCGKEIEREEIGYEEIEREKVIRQEDKREEVWRKEIIAKENQR